MTLVSVYEVPAYIEMLYRLLQERTPQQSISHRGMPSFKEHTAFVESRPYIAWFALYDGPALVGTVYLTKAREIGVFLFRKYWGNGYGAKAVQELMRLHPGEVLANINPANEMSLKLFGELGFKIIQVTLRGGVHEDRKDTAGA